MKYEHKTLKYEHKTYSHKNHQFDKKLPQFESSFENKEDIFSSKQIIGEDDDFNQSNDLHVINRNNLSDTSSDNFLNSILINQIDRIEINLLNKYFTQ